MRVPRCEADRGLESPAAGRCRQPMAAAAAHQTLACAVVVGAAADAVSSPATAGTAATGRRSVSIVLSAVIVAAYATSAIGASNIGELPLATLNTTPPLFPPSTTPSCLLRLPVAAASNRRFQLVFPGLTTNTFGVFYSISNRFDGRWFRKYVTVGNETGAITIDEPYACVNGAVVNFELNGFSKDVRVVLPVQLVFEQCDYQGSKPNRQPSSPPTSRLAPEGVIEVIFRSRRLASGGSGQNYSSYDSDNNTGRRVGGSSSSGLADRRVCLRKSQFIVKLSDLVVATCVGLRARVTRWRWDADLSDLVAVEHVGGDVVYRGADHCFDDEHLHFWLWLTCRRLLPTAAVVAASGISFETGRPDVQAWPAKSASDYYIVGKRFVDTASRAALDSNQVVGGNDKDDDVDGGRVSLPAVRISWTHDRIRVRRSTGDGDHLFATSMCLTNVPEGKDPGYLVDTISIRQPNPSVRYSLEAAVDARSHALFRIDSGSGVVMTTHTLDRERMHQHFLRVIAVDYLHDPPLTGTTTLQVTVLDENDHAPQFEQSRYEASARESSPIGSTILTARATDADDGQNAVITYSLLFDVAAAPSAAGTFAIDATSGVIYTKAALDRERVAEYHIMIRAEDGAPIQKRLSSTATLTLTVLDDNDNYPQFSQRSYSVQVAENISWIDKPEIVRIAATDADANENAALRFSIIGGNSQNHFAIDSLTGSIRAVSPLDYEALSSYRLVVRVQDGGSPSKSNTTNVLIDVVDVNDNDPRFYAAEFHESVPENAEKGHSIIQVQAFDADSGDNAKITYSLLSSDGSDPSLLPVYIEPDTGWVRVGSQLDYERRTEYRFTVLARDNGIPQRSASAAVILAVQDVNDNDPRFEEHSYSAVVSEKDPPGTPVITLTAHDPDKDNRLQYHIASGNHRDRFGIISQNGAGIVSIAQPLDYKLENRFALSVIVSDTGGRTDTAILNINITDANNHRPTFVNTPYTSSIPEDTPVGTTVLVIEAIDNDVGQNARVTYTLEDAVSVFKIEPDTGAIVTSAPLDRESMSGYTLVVTAQDEGRPPLSDSTSVEIEILDVNDNAPKFAMASYTSEVSEDAFIGTSIVQVTASDDDLGLNAQVRYTFTGGDDGQGAFSIDPTSGLVRTAKHLDREAVAMYQLKAVAVDRGSPQLSSTVPITVFVQDINDSPPRFDSDKIQIFVRENVPLGSVIGTIEAKDPDEGLNAVVTYSIVGGPDADSFSLISKPSGPVDIVSRVEFDYEGPKKRYIFSVRAASPPLRTDAQVEIWVTDINDNAPVLKNFLIVFNNFKNFFPIGPIGRIPANDPDVTDTLHFKFTSGNRAQLLELNETSGEITLSPNLNTDVAIDADFQVSVFDGINEVSASCKLHVRWISEGMLNNSITIRMQNMTVERFLSPAFDAFVSALSAVIPCPRENVFIFNIQQDTARILNVSFSVVKVRNHEELYSSRYIQERMYLGRSVLQRLSDIEVFPFDDYPCSTEPCLNFERCESMLKFKAAEDFISSDRVLFRPIRPSNTFICVCPLGFTGMSRHIDCDTEINFCYSSPCRNGGYCMQTEGGYFCDCINNFHGRNCEVAGRSNSSLTGNSAPLPIGAAVHCTGSDSTLDDMCRLRGRSFPQHGTYVTFQSLRRRHRFSIRLSFATPNLNGLLFYNGRYNDRDDFIAMELVDGRLVFSFSTGGNVMPTTVSAFKAGLNDGNWHTAVVTYQERVVSLSIDGCDPVIAERLANDNNYQCAGRGQLQLDPRCNNSMEGCFRLLDLTGPFQLGGLPQIMSHFPVENRGFVGCMKDLHIDHELVDLNQFVANNLTIAGCPSRRGFCHIQPCLNGGTCHESWNGYKCRCPDGFGGPECQNRVEPYRFHGDGQLMFKSSLRPIETPWSVRLSMRTRHRDGLLMVVQLGGNSKYFVLRVINNTIAAAVDDAQVSIEHLSVADGEWHHVHFWWNANVLGLSVDGDHYRAERHTHQSPAGHYMGDAWVGGYEGNMVIGDDLRSNVGQASEREIGDNGNRVAELVHFRGCVENLQIGSAGQHDAYREPSSERNVYRGCSVENSCASSPCPESSVCENMFEGFRCNCHPGFVGSQCLPICSLHPCEHNTTSSCATATNKERGYTCICDAKHYGERCQLSILDQCPANWWGTPPSCGPCHCNVKKGYSADCDKQTGNCTCDANHYFSPERRTCLSCSCYSPGSIGMQCESLSGQCRCREGVIGKNCDSCSNEFAEVTAHGCEVVYDGCPRAHHSRVWWPRTALGAQALTVCPPLAQGKCSRFCDPNDGWQLPDLFDCLSDPLAPLAEELTLIEQSNIQLRAHNSRRLARELDDAVRRSLTNNANELYGSDVRTVSQALTLILAFESEQTGFNLSHTQDRHFVKYIVRSLATVVDSRLTSAWQRLPVGVRIERLLARVEQYGRRLLANMADTFTAPFLLGYNDNVFLGVDQATPAELHVDNTTASYIYGVAVAGGGAQRVLPLVRLPKFNNVPVQKLPMWMPRVGVPLPSITLDTYGNDTKALFYMAAFREASSLYPLMYDSTINHVFGASVSSAVVSLSVAKSDSKFQLLEQLSEENRVYISFPILHGRFPRNPQCVFWYVSPSTGYGKWSARGCRVESFDTTLVNCSCDHLSTYAVLTEDTYTLARTQISYSQELSTSVALIFSIALLTTTVVLLMALTVASGGYSTNSHAIHLNVIICLLLVDLVSLIGIRSHAPASTAACRLVAIGVHFSWLAVFSWLLVDLLHIYRMLTEMKDVNHGSMKFYFSLAYGAPALIVALTLGIRSDLYAGYNFCWLSATSSLVWSQAGPVAALIAGALLLATASVLASVRVQGVELISDFGNIRFLLWLAMAQLPIITFYWLSSMFAASGASHGWLLFSICAPLAALSVFLCQCILNARVRQNLWEMLRGRRKCLLAYYSGGGGAQLSGSRSALSYGGRTGAADISMQGTLQRRHVIMGAYSTTSRSTTHRSSSFGSTEQSGTRSQFERRSKGNRRKARAGERNDTCSEGSGSRGSRGSDYLDRERQKYGSQEDLHSVDQESMDLASSHSSDKDTLTYTEEAGYRRGNYSDTEDEVDANNETVNETLDPSGKISALKVSRERQMNAVVDTVLSEELGSTFRRSSLQSYKQSQARTEDSLHSTASPALTPRTSVYASVQHGPSVTTLTTTGARGSVGFPSPASNGVSAQVALTRLSSSGSPLQSISHQQMQLQEQERPQQYGLHVQQSQYSDAIHQQNFHEKSQNQQWSESPGLHYGGMPLPEDRVSAIGTPTVTNVSSNQALAAKVADSSSPVGYGTASDAAAPSTLPRAKPVAALPFQTRMLLLSDSAAPSAATGNTASHRISRDESSLPPHFSKRHQHQQQHTQQQLSHQPQQHSLQGPLVVPQATDAKGNLSSSSCVANTPEDSGLTNLSKDVEFIDDLSSPNALGGDETSV